MPSRKRSLSNIGNCNNVEPPKKRMRHNTSSKQNQEQRQDLHDRVNYISILNLNEQESTLTPKQLLSHNDNDDRFYILSDLDHELLILVQFKYFVDLTSITFKAMANSKMIKKKNASSPGKIYIKRVSQININFDDIGSLKKGKLIKCCVRKLQKGQRIDLNKDLRNVAKFKNIKYLAIFIETNQDKTEFTYLNGLTFEGKTHPQPKGSSFKLPERSQNLCGSVRY